MGNHMTEATHYDYAIDPEGDSTANKVLKYVGHDRHVLELGTASGVMTRAMHERGCIITGVERVPARAERAAPYCERMLVADLETLDFSTTFADTRFDVLVAADVLEHLHDPWSLLEKARHVISTDGYLVISVPNIAHAVITAGLISGRFDYRDKGLLDHSHLRFFTRAGIQDMLLGTGWVPIQWDTYRVAPLQTEFASHWLSLPEPSRQLLQQHPDSDVYQFIVKAVPASEIGWQRALQARTTQLEQALQDCRRDLDLINEQHSVTLTDLKEHQKAFAEAREWIARLQEELSAAQGQLTESQNKLASSRQELEKAQQSLALAEEELASTIAELAHFKRGPRCLFACFKHWLDRSR